MVVLDTLGSLLGTTVAEDDTDQPQSPPCPMVQLRRTQDSLGFQY